MGSDDTIQDGLHERASLPRRKINVDKTIVAVSSVGYTLGLLFFVVRMIIRARKRTTLGPQDYFLIFGMLTFTGYFISLIAACANGLGKHIWDLSLDSGFVIGAWSMCLTQFYLWSSVGIKSSIISLLKSFHRDVKAWQWSLEGVRVFLFLLAICATCFDFIHCRPLRAFWDYSFSRSVCGTNSMYRNFVTSISSFLLLTDVILSFAPMFIIHKIRCPFREKIVISILMGLGLFCAAAIIPKIVDIRQYGKTVDYVVTIGYVSMWSAVEISIGIIVACVPNMKALFESTLRKARLLSSALTISSNPKNMQLNSYAGGESSFADTLTVIPEITAEKRQNQLV